MKRTQVLNLGKHFSIIDSPVPFYLIDNYGFRAYRPAGAWQFDNWKLLPEKFHKNYPVYTLSIEWESGENDDIIPEFTDTDLDLGDGIAGVNGQPVNISNPVDVVIKSMNFIDGFNYYDRFNVNIPSDSNGPNIIYCKGCYVEMGVVSGGRGYELQLTDALLSVSAMPNPASPLFMYVYSNRGCDVTNEKKELGSFASYAGLNSVSIVGVCKIIRNL